MKALICITTANRCTALRRFVWEYAEFCTRRSEYDFLVSLDGRDPATIAFCGKYGFPLVYSDEREGVGISKNRVLTRFPDYDHYFFVEDDVGLIDERVFDRHIEVAREMNLHHLSLFPPERLPADAVEVVTSSGAVLVCSMYGSAQFNYFSKRGIEIVGGFDPVFAKYRRFGHTEHSYRFVHNRLATYPFYMIKDCLNCVQWENPVSVTRIRVNTRNHVFEGEHELIERKQMHVPIVTLSPHHLQSGKDKVWKERPLVAVWHRIVFDTHMSALTLFRRIKGLLRPRAG